MAAAHARDAARAVAATHQALTWAFRSMAAMLLHFNVAGGVRIVWAIAAGIEMDLGLGGADRAKHQCDCDE